MKHRTGILLTAMTALIILAGCQNETTGNSSIYPTSSEQLSALYNPGNLPDQHYFINPERDTLLRGKNGTVLRIDKNTFVDASGKPVTSSVTVALKEALHPSDIVFANLTTTSNGKPLQTGGMIWTGASSNGQEVRIANDKAIGVTIPQPAVLPNMQVYSGSETANGINWVEPVPVLNNSAAQPEKQRRKKKNYSSATKNSIDEMDAIFGYIDSDTTGMFAAEQENQRRAAEEKSVNYYEVDEQTNYIFELKKLGWANIDRLYEDPRTEPVELATTIKNSKQFEPVYITMVISKMYLPGYQMKNGSFSFTHGDYEEHQLPIGEKATIFATAYHGGVPYFDLVQVTIQPVQKITLELKKSSPGELKQTLQSKL